MIEGIEVLSDEYACKCDKGWHPIGTQCPDKKEPITEVGEVGYDGYI